MATLAPLLLIAIVAVALVGWFFAVTAAFKVWNASPSGRKVANYMQLGLLQFSTLEARLGPSIRPTLVRYRNGLLIFFACIVVAILLSFASIAVLNS